MTSRRNFITGAAGAMVGASLVSKAGAAAIPEAPVQSSPATQPPRSLWKTRKRPSGVNDETK